MNKAAKSDVQQCFMSAVLVAFNYFHTDIYFVFDTITSAFVVGKKIISHR